MPELDGVAVVTALRALGNDIPICVLSARDTVNDRIAGLEAGADDYLTKPFDLGELVARLHALLRRASHSDQPSDTMTVGPLTIDTARRLVFVDGERVDLTKREFDLLAVLAENAGVVLSPPAAARTGVGLRLRRRHQRRRRVHLLPAAQARTRRPAAGDPHGSRDRVRVAGRAVASAAVPRAWPAFGPPRCAPGCADRRRPPPRPRSSRVFTILTSVVLANNDAAQLDRRLDSIVDASMYPDATAGSPPRRADHRAIRVHRAGGVPARLPAAAAAAGHRDGRSERRRVPGAHHRRRPAGRRADVDRHPRRQHPVEPRQDSAVHGGRSGDGVDRRRPWLAAGRSRDPAAAPADRAHQAARQGHRARCPKCTASARPRTCPRR